MRKSIIILIFLFFVLQLGCFGTAGAADVSVAKAGEIPAVFLQDDVAFMLGRDRLLTGKYIHLVEGKNIAIMANITAQKTVDMLIDNPQVTLRAIFAPEHGFYGKTGAGIYIDDDVYRNVPIYGCYGGGDETRRIPLQMLEDIDVLLFEVQDIGARHYTFISSMYLAMDSAADAGIPFVVLDRPNAASNMNVEGPVLEPEYQSFLGVGSFPICYAMTIGELAQMFRDESELMHGPRYPRILETDAYHNIKDLKLTIVPMTGYDRSKMWDEVMTGEPWVSTSPNIPGVMSAVCYAGTGLMAGNTIDEIVSEFQQFQVLAFPFIKTREEMTAFVKEAKKHYDFPGVSLSQAVHPKTFQENIIVLEVYDKLAFRPVATALSLMYTQRKLYPGEKFLTNEKAEELSGKMIGNAWIFGTLMQEKLPTFQSILDKIAVQEFEFNKIRWQYLLY